MDDQEFRQRLAIAMAGSNVKTFASTPDAVELLWRAVDAVCAAETKPAEAPSDDGSRRINPEYYPTIADYQAAQMQLVALDVRANEARNEAANWQAQAGQWKVKAEAAEEKNKDLWPPDLLTPEGYKEKVAALKARAEAAEAQLTEAREFIAAMEEREVKRDEQEADARECAEWIIAQDRALSYASAKGETVVSAARRLLAGKPSPKAAPDPAKACPRCQCELTPGSAHAWRTEDTCYVVSATATAAPVPPPDNPPAHRFDCDHCGKGIAVDEDGCCAMCGADARVIPPPDNPPAAKVEPFLRWDRQRAFVGELHIASLTYEGPNTWRAHYQGGDRLLQDQDGTLRCAQVEVERLLGLRSAALKWLDRRVAEAAAAPKPPSASMERDAMTVKELRALGSVALSRHMDVSQIDVDYPDDVASSALRDEPSEAAK